MKWHSIKLNDSKALDEYSLFLSECEHAVNNIDSRKPLEYLDNMKRLLLKLPYFMQGRWCNIAKKSKDEFEQIKVHDLVIYVKAEYQKANHSVYG